MISLREVRFRSNPLVELKRLDELDAEERQPFLPLQNDPEFHALLVPRPPLTMNIKSVERPAAAFFQSLTTPARLDRTLLNDRDEADDVVDLVLDGFLEIESSDGFVSGADAFPLLFPPLGDAALGTAAARLSRDALLHAQDLETNHATALATALYYYYRIPMTPFWKARLPDRNAVRAHLGIDRGALRLLLEREWTEITQENRDGWLSWASRAEGPEEPGGAGYKLYISPRPELIGDVFETVVRVLSEFSGLVFKVGDDASGILRSEKLVAYFTDRQALDEVAALLRRELSGCAAHGVPFTAGFDGSGLLSWGVDPPKNPLPLPWITGESWRQWVTRQLGPALSIAKLARTAAAVEPWRFAMERVRRAGVDVETWTPAPSLWGLS